MDNTLPPLKRIAAIHDLSGLGKCSLTVALPVISATGVECACIPTAVLSTHTGEFTGWTFRDLSDDMLSIAHHWQRIGVRIDGVYSGYLASPEQAQLLAQTLDCIAAPDTLVVIDPVMADNGSYYSKIDDRMCAAFRRLLSRADVITPNVTEAALLAGLPYEPGTHSDAYLAQLFQALGALGAGIVTVTGVRPQPDVIGNVACDCRTGEMHVSMRPAHPGVFYGTGDVFASALAALLVRGAPLSAALETATALTDESICRSLWRDTPRRFGVDFEGALLAGLPYEPGTHSDAYLAQLFQALGALGAGIVTVTGVRPQPDVIGNVACDCRTGEMHVSMRPAHPGVFYGTGDVFASALAALLVRGAPLSAALETATALTDESICRSLWRDTPRRFGVDFEGALPAYIRRVEKIFEA